MSSTSSSGRRVTMSTRRRAMTFAAVILAAVVATPTIASACNLPVRAIGPFDVKRHDVRRPIERDVTPSRWNLDGTWTSVDPQLNQTLRTRRVGTYVNVSFAAQRSLSIDALPPDTYGWRWIEDDDPATTCTLAGQHAWQTPSFLVVEGRREIRILAISRRTPGDSTGCSMEDGSFGLPCPNLATTTVRLKRPVGMRKIVFERFAADTASQS